MLEFIATQLTFITAPFLGFTLGFYYTMKTVKALELAFLSLPLDIRFHGYLAPIFSAKCKSEAEGGLQINCSSLVPSCIQALFYSCVRSPASWPIPFIVLFYLRRDVSRFCCHWVPFLHRSTPIRVHSSGTMRWERIAVSPHHHQEVSLWREFKLKLSIWSFGSCRNVCAFNLKHGGFKCLQSKLPVINLVPRCFTKQTFTVIALPDTHSENSHS